LLGNFIGWDEFFGNFFFAYKELFGNFLVTKTR
jgi:hypothetical protein